jgi:hypothetical protein
MLNDVVNISLVSLSIKINDLPSTYRTSCVAEVTITAGMTQ